MLTLAQLTMNSYSEEVLSYVVTSGIISSLGVMLKLVSSANSVWSVILVVYWFMFGLAQLN